MKPWREVAVPHADVLEGTFQQSEFAADISAVQAGKATREYQDAAAFFQRTYITEGMRQLLIHVAQRLNGQGGEPVIQLQTAFGGGKTHTMLAVYHLATRPCSLGELTGIPALLDQAGLMDVPRARVAVLDGQDLAPGQPWKHGKLTVKTLWGELACQLGGAEGFSRVQESDATGTSPGKEVLRALLEAYAPCVVLIDELVAFVRQFPQGQTLSAGSFDSNLSFVQALTEAVKLVPGAIVLGSLPESEVEVGGQRGLAALKALEKTFGRVQALWRPVATEEAFEIVRRRLFEPVSDVQSREAVCRAFAKAYTDEGARLPGETQEARYLERLLQAYPIHPEVFDRLYEDWTTIEGFQRTRGVLKLMAKVIYRLWKDENKDLMILAGSLPLYDAGARNELTYYLPAGWDAVLEKDIDGDRAETTELESREPRFGAVHAARRVARTLFLGSAPSSASTKPGIRGLDRARILLGCVQPGQSCSVYSDALNRLADKLHYLNSSGDKTQDATRFWFDTRANLRREMEERKKRFDDRTEVRARLDQALKPLIKTSLFDDGVHRFLPHGDVPDDERLRLVVLPPEAFYLKEEPRLAYEAVHGYLKNHGSGPRYRANRLLFLAADNPTLPRLKDSLRTVLAWKSIVEDVEDGRLNIDQLQKRQADKELQLAQDVLPKVVRECYRWLLCPVQHSPTDSKIDIEAFPLNASGASLGGELERTCADNELIIGTWSPIHLRSKLQELYWKPDRPAVGALAFFEDSLRYLNLPRLKDRAVLEQAIQKGTSSRDFFGTAYGQFEGRFDGFKLGDAQVQLDDTLLLIQPQVAQQYEADRKKEAEEAARASAEEAARTIRQSGSSASGVSQPGPSGSSKSGPTGQIPLPPDGQPAAKLHSFFGSAEIPPAAAKFRLAQLADEIISLLVSDPQASVKVRLEIEADFPQGVSENLRRAVSENADTLGLKTKSWE